MMSILTMFKDWLTIIKNYALIVLKVIVSIGVFYCFYIAGLKGILTFIIGMAVMAYLILSDNPMLRMAIEITQKKGESQLRKPNKLLKR